MNEPPGYAPPPYKDRTAGLIVFGVLELGIALLCLLGFGAVLLSLGSLAAMEPAAAPTMNKEAVVAGSFFYLLMAAFFGTMGVGSFLARRWARTLMLIVSWAWLLVGVFATIVAFFLFGKIFAAAGPPGDPQAETFVQGCVGLIMVLFYILLPLAFLLFYRSPHVKATVEAKDPVIRWTDRCPAPVLALSLLYGYAVVACLMSLGYRAVPIFGRVVTGPAAIVLVLVFAGVCAWLAVALYRLRPVAWWTALALWVLGSASSVFLFLPGFDWLDLYRDMGMLTPQMEQMGETGFFEMMQSPLILVSVVLMGLGGLGYLLWVKRYFGGRERYGAS